MGLGLPMLQTQEIQKLPVAFINDNLLCSTMNINKLYKTGLKTNYDIENVTLNLACFLGILGQSLILCSNWWMFLSDFAPSMAACTCLTKGKGKVYKICFEKSGSNLLSTIRNTYIYMYYPF